MQSTSDARYCSLKDAILNDLGAADATPAVKRQLDRWDKRFPPSADELGQLHEQCVLDFIKLNDSVRAPYGSLRMNVAIGEAQAFIRDALVSFTRSTGNSTPQCVIDTPTLIALWRFGPGSSRGIRSTHFAEKIYEKMTTTPECLLYTRLIRAYTPLIARHDNSCVRSSKGIKIVQGSRLGSVGKNREKNRTIATEPSGNMALQLALGSYITLALKRIGLDIATQEEKNKVLAFRASITRLLATMDLKSASDMFSIELIQLLWPPEFYHLFMVFRSHFCEVEVRGKKRELKLNMMSTMGNGFTFPMMTMTLLALLYGVMRSHGDLKNKRCDWSRMGVYGDDIICPVEYFNPLAELLQECGLLINFDKSCLVGPFRESCGGDYDAGVEITPFYIEALTCDSEVFVAINKVLKWAAFHDVKMWNTLRFLYSLLEHKYFVPEWEAPNSGILSIAGKRRYKYLSPVMETRDKYICTDLDVLSIIGGYVESPPENERHRHFFMRYTPRQGESLDDDEDEITKYEVKNARYPKEYRDGHDPLYQDRECSVYVQRILDILVCAD